MKNLLNWLKEQAARRRFLSNTLMLAGGTLGRTGPLRSNSADLVQALLCGFYFLRLRHAATQGVVISES